MIRKISSCQHFLFKKSSGQFLVFKGLSGHNFMFKRPYDQPFMLKRSSVQYVIFKRSSVRHWNGISAGRPVIRVVCTVLVHRVTQISDLILGRTNILNVYALPFHKHNCTWVIRTSHLSMCILHMCLYNNWSYITFRLKCNVNEITIYFIHQYTFLTVVFFITHIS
jgi:hypothetical protein